jgi:competence protein ComFC
MNFFSSILELLFPKRCISCNNKNEQGLCLKCITSIPLHANNTNKTVVSVFPYRHPVVKKIIWEFKFNGDFEPLSKLMDKVHDVLIDELSDKNIFNNFQNPLLVPIPLHINRRKARGFNQSEIIARELCKRNKILFDLEEKSLIRERETESQAKITHRKERFKNIHNCFKVTNPQRFHNRNIILIDDITTTGATLEEATKVLKRAGARNVYACTIAQ